MTLISNVWKRNASRVNVNIVVGSELLAVLPQVLFVPKVR